MPRMKNYRSYKGGRMTDRYTRLYLSPENQYLAGSPVVISAGALLKDNQNGRIIAQLKFKRISKESIKALKVSICAYDAMGELVDDNIEYIYMDINPERDEEFGQKTPIILKNPTIRSFTAAVTEVAFFDNSIWRSKNRGWEDLHTAMPITFFVNDQELIKQIKLEYGRDSKYIYSQENAGVWYCICGALNTSEDTLCHNCHRPLEELKKIDLKTLELHKEERLQKEREEAEERRVEEEKELQIKEAQERDCLEKREDVNKKVLDFTGKISSKSILIAIAATIAVIACVFGIKEYRAQRNPMYYVSHYIVENGVQYEENRYTMDWMVDIMDGGDVFWGVDKSISEDGIYCIYEMNEQSQKNSDSNHTALLTKISILFPANNGVGDYAVTYLYKGKEYQTSGTYDFSNYEKGNVKINGTINLDDGKNLSQETTAETLEKIAEASISFITKTIETENLKVSLSDLGFESR